MTASWGWVLLLVAGVLDIGWADAMKKSDGLTRLGWTVLAVAILGLIVIAIGRALLTIPVGTAYAVFTGVGAIGTAALGIFAFGESAAPLRLACIGLIVAGAIGLKLFPA